MDPTEIGKYGTLRLIKRSDPTVSVASFPIDEETVTFGRDTKCSVRLYYPTVSLVHAKLIFQDRKVRLSFQVSSQRTQVAQAFLIVLGENGLHIDGCQVFPSSNPSLPSTIPVSNNSEIEIHKKRFVFTYPPKEFRTALYESPQKNAQMTPGTRRKALRMSMINSAVVFTPRPSNDPRENLRILQTPLKSPLKKPAYSARDIEEEQDEGDDIVLVEGNHPQVVEEEKDLIVLESVEVEEEPEPVQPQRSPAKLLSARYTQQYQTPRKRPGSRPSLHRAVLIRSAQKAFMKHEEEREEEEEEREVEEFVAETVEEVPEEDEEDDEEAEGPQEDEENPMGPSAPSSPWRKSLDFARSLAWPFRSSSAQPEVEEEQDEEVEEDDEEEEQEQEQEQEEAEYDEDDEQENEVDGEEMDVDEHVDDDLPDEHDLAPEDPEVKEEDDENVPPLPAPTKSAASGTPIRSRLLGQFMTPQVHAAGGRGRGAGRNSYGGGGFIHTPAGMGSTGGARRVRVEPSWKVSDLVVPVPHEREVLEEEQGGEEAGEEEEEEEEDAPASYVPPLRQRISDEERKAIQERRRSALAMPDPYFGGRTPGLGPEGLVGGGGTPVASPVKRESVRVSMSPSKAMATFREENSVGDEEGDTRSLLDRMKRTVEDMKRRRSSIGLPMSVVSDGEHDDAEREDEDMEEGQDEDEDEAQAVPESSLDIEPSSDAAPAGEMAAPPTPHLDLKHMFAQPKGVQSTPAVKSLRDLFKPSTEHAHAAEVGETPRMDSLRHMFSNVEREDARSTPRMDGLRHMFPNEERLGGVGGTPAYEGVGEMFGTPVAAGPAPVTEEEAVREPEVSAPAPRPVASRLRAPTATRPKAVRVSAEPVAAKPASKDAAEVRPRARLLKAQPKEVPTILESDDDEEEDGAEATGATATRSTRARGVKAPATETKTTRTTRKRSATPVSGPAETRTARSEPGKRTTAGTASKTAAASRTAAASKAAATESKGMRRGRATPQPGDASKSKATTAARSRSTARSKSRERGRKTDDDHDGEDDDDEDDPLDAIGGDDDIDEGDAKPKSKAKAAPAPAASSRMAKATRSHAHAAVKDEPVETGLPSKGVKKTAAAATPATRTRAAVAAATTSKKAEISRIPSRSALRTNKENTPSVEDDDSEPSAHNTAKTATTAGKTLRGKKAAGSEGEGKSEVLAKTNTRTTRATRTRGTTS
ncbi:hypothetical protein CONPUDRAFT_82884 [Coniophora puteana RWD-64-598 SS2]|uniref:FHA domain-containing protein n=1 Tax=Coniophora puteana (strain RWD-64-598) TaxID=741705 RepID=A0A5M3MK67_CONPW|nr:uncharacterized protein CONPUDRAFT_82884 [Coniophora puteana RWD-64-598 SS2]EIW79456.1 hypothetical protein CONPUDRAFT_82884 [Coniophora puteana RWD-64-598 SS2]